MGGHATIEEKPATLYLRNARAPSHAPMPGPLDQTGFPGSFMPPPMYGYPPGMPIWNYPPGHGLGMPPSGPYLGTQLLIMMNSTSVPGNAITSSTVQVVFPDVIAWFAYLD